MFKPAPVFLEGCSENHLTACYDFGGKPIVHLFRSQQRYATVVVLPVIPGEEGWQKQRLSCMEPNRSGNCGQYFRVLS